MGRGAQHHGELADEASKMALAGRSNLKGRVHRSDHGAQYVSLLLSKTMRDEAALDVFECIEVIYNRARIHSALGDLSPAEFEEANWPECKGRPKAA